MSAGTSLAVPKVSATIGVLISHQKKIGGRTLTPSMIGRILKKSATDLGKKGTDSIYGYGLVNLNKALELLEKDK
ncbi:Serotype-specific antigen 1 precursor [compost metagenome]